MPSVNPDALCSSGNSLVSALAVSIKFRIDIYFAAKAIVRCSSPGVTCRTWLVKDVSTNSPRSALLFHVSQQSPPHATNCPVRKVFHLQEPSVVVINIDRANLFVVGRQQNSPQTVYHRKVNGNFFGLSIHLYVYHRRLCPELKRSRFTFDQKRLPAPRCIADIST